MRFRSERPMRPFSVAGPHAQFAAIGPKDVDECQENAFVCTLVLTLPKPAPQFSSCAYNKLIIIMRHLAPIPPFYQFIS